MRYIRFGNQSKQVKLLPGGWGVQEQQLVWYFIKVSCLLHIFWSGALFHLTLLQHSASSNEGRVVSTQGRNLGVEVMEEWYWLAPWLLWSMSACYLFPGCWILIEKESLLSCSERHWTLKQHFCWNYSEIMACLLILHHFSLIVLLLLSSNGQLSIFLPGTGMDTNRNITSYGHTHIQFTWITLYCPFEFFSFVINLSGIWKLFVLVLENMACIIDYPKKRIWI